MFRSRALTNNLYKSFIRTPHSSFGSVFAERSRNKVKGALTRQNILSLPSTPAWSPSYPLGPYYFKNREYFIIEYEADIEDLKRVVPEPLVPASNKVLYEWIGMPDSSGFGSCKY